MRVRTGHVSLQYSDTDKQHTSDIEKIFGRAADRRLAWITGTEAGPGSGNTGRELLRVAKAAGYRPWVPSEQSKASGRATDCWLAVRADLIKSGWKTRFLPAIPGSSELYKAQGLDSDLNPRWGPKGLVAVGFNSIPQLGEVHLGVAHHLTDGRDPKLEIRGVNHYELNEKLDEVIAEWMKEVGAGPAIAFCNLDRNFGDTKTDKQKIGTAVTLADELKKWQNTGHGPIDWMMSNSKDGRVKGRNFVAYNDRQFPLFTDHYYCEGVFDVEPLAS